MRYYYVSAREDLYPLLVSVHILASRAFLKTPEKLHFGSANNYFKRTKLAEMLFY